eukprot:SAG22_NODE_1893_length_3367_cov_2.848531_6_plen_51_part_00
MSATTVVALQGGAKRVRPPGRLLQWRVSRRASEANRHEPRGMIDAPTCKL